MILVSRDGHLVASDFSFRIFFREILKNIVDIIGVSRKIFRIKKMEKNVCGVDIVVA